MAQTETSPLRFAWKLKMGIILAVLVPLAAWFYIDASIVYPAKGEKMARWAEREYLAQAAGGPNRPFPIQTETVSVDNPAGEYDRLRRRDAEGGALSAVEERRLEWLKALSHIDGLEPQRTTYQAGALGEPGQRLDELDAEFAGLDAPKPLRAYDIAVQWIIFFVLAGVALYLAGFVAVVSRRRFQFDPENHALTLPGGQTITPEDIEEIDKRKWDKYYVFLKIRQGHPELGGRTLKIDLYRRDRVEDWILEMERIRFPELVAQEEAEKAAEEAADGAADAESDAASEAPAPGA